MDNNQRRSRVAIACQGGGSHTAFTGGVLQGLMEALPDDVDVVALSGTSGGAICATLAWEGLLRNDRKRAVQKLRGFWKAMAATDPIDRLVNGSLVSIMALRDLMVMPEISPYYVPPWGQDHFREVLNECFDFDELRELARRPGAPILYIGAVEVLTGHFEQFTGEELCGECLLASAAIPELFRAVSVPGRGVFWDGLFSQNPPIHDLARHQIDELWLIQINSSTWPRIPTATHEIMDRRNALSGNLSLEQEISFIEMVNQAISEGRFKDPNLRPIRITRIELDRDLGYRSKLDRHPRLLNDLEEYGRTKCRMFLKERDARIMQQDSTAEAA